MLPPFYPHRVSIPTPPPFASERVDPSWVSPHPDTLSLCRIRPILWLGQDKAGLCYMCAGDLVPAWVCAFIGGSVSGSSQGSRLVDTVSFPVGFPFSSGTSILPLTLP